MAPVKPGGGFGVATHCSIVWGVTLAILTLLEWHSLDRDPVRQAILSPFIERNIAVSVANRPAPADELAAVTGTEDAPDAQLRYEVDFRFNGPLFLAWFFIPILLFHAVGMLWNYLRR